MGERTAYPPGQFSWIDLGANDYDEAKVFYGGLFGWEFYDQEVGENQYYGMAYINDRQVAAVFENPDLQKMGIPPHWTSYITVEDAEATTSQCREAGAKIIHEPFDVFSAGRMGVCQDPAGGHFSIWQPRDSIGARWVNEPNAWCWSELNTRNIDAAKKFYQTVFGWDFQLIEKINYYSIKNGNLFNAGAHDITGKVPDEVPAHWLVYFRVDDTHRALEQVTKLGGKILTGPFSTPMGNISVVADPQGGHFALTDLDQMDD